MSFKLALIYASITMGVDYKSYNYYLKMGGDVKGLSVTLLFYIILSHMLSRGHLSTGCFGYRDYWSRWSSRSCGWLRAKTQSGSRVVVPQAVNAPRALNRPVYVVDMYSGVEGYVRALREIASVEGVDCIVGVDVGGDSLASGSEEELWSPLADWVELVAGNSL